MTDLRLPDVLRIDEVAAFMRRSAKGIRNAMSDGVFLPMPFTANPYRWRREDLEAWYRGEYRESERKLREQARKRRKAA